MKFLISFVCFILLSSFVNAGQVTGVVTSLQAGHGYTPDNVYFLVGISGDKLNAPSCASKASLVINPATEAGEVFVSMLLSAKAAGQTLTIYGGNKCDLIDGFESVSYIKLD